MESDFRRILALDPPPSPARVVGEGGRQRTATRLRIGVVQHAWQPDAVALAESLSAAVGLAAAEGARIVFLPELTLSRYPADSLPAGRPDDEAEYLRGGPTLRFAAAAATSHGVLVHASLYERSPEKLDDESDDGLGLNTAIVVAPDGEVVARTHKLHLPVTAGYYEDRYFRPGPGAGAAGAPAEAAGPYPVYSFPGVAGARIGLPTCWDEWFPEVARAYALGGADVVVYPTAIGSEPDHPDFDTQPLWQQVIVGNGIANGLFMVAPNRTGHEAGRSGGAGTTFYGSSFVSDPYGRILAQAPRDEQAVLVVDLDLGQRKDWLDLFPFLRTRRPDTYAALTSPVDPALPYGAAQSHGAAQ